MNELRLAYCGGKPKFRQNLDHLTRHTGWPRWAFKTEARRQGWTRAEYRPWTPNEDAFVREHAGAMSIKEIARILKRSHESVTARVNLVQSIRQTREGYTPGDLAKLFGARPEKVRRWIEKGLLGASRSFSPERASWEPTYSGLSRAATTSMTCARCIRIGLKQWGWRKRDKGILNMAFDSAADLLFNIGVNSDDAEANMARFRQLLGTDLDALGAQFEEWSNKVFGEMETVKRGVDRDHIRGGRAGRGSGRVWRGSGEQVRGVRYRGRRCRAKDGAHYADLSAMHLAAHETGVSFEQVTTGLVRFERSVFAAQAATSKQAQMLARM